MIKCLIACLLFLSYSPRGYDNCLKATIFARQYDTTASSCFEIIGIPLEKTNEDPHGSFGYVKNCKINLVGDKPITVAMKVLDLKHSNNKKHGQYEVKTFEKLNYLNDYRLPLYYGCIIDYDNDVLFIFMEKLDYEFGLTAEVKEEEEKDAAGNSIDKKRLQKMTECPLKFNSLVLYRQLEVILELARAFARLHKEGIGHFDIKPNNIMVKSEEWIIKPVDFGFAYQKNILSREQQKFQTSSQSLSLGILNKDEEKFNSEARTTIIDESYGHWYLRGTPRFLDPSMAKSELFDLSSDVYSLGMSLIEVIFSMVGEDKEGFNLQTYPSHMQQLFSKHIAENDFKTGAASSYKIEKGWRVMLKAILLKMIDKSPKKRPGMAGVVNQVEQLLLLVNPSSKHLKNLKGNSVTKKKEANRSISSEITSDTTVHEEPDELTISYLRRHKREYNPFIFSCIYYGCKSRPYRSTSLEHLKKYLNSKYKTWDTSDKEDDEEEISARLLGWNTNNKALFSGNYNDIDRAVIISPEWKDRALLDTIEIDPPTRMKEDCCAGNNLRKCITVFCGQMLI